MKYEVQWSNVVYYYVVVEAETPDEALKKADAGVESGELDPEIGEEFDNTPCEAILIKEEPPR